MLQIEFGALGDALGQQFRKQGYYLENSDKWEKIRYSINMLHIHGFITYKQWNMMFEKLYKKMQCDFKRIESR